MALLYIRNPTEDPDAPIHPDSICALLDGRTLDDYCDDCASPAVFITASAVDFTLKQQEDDIYYRERLAFLPVCGTVSFPTDSGQSQGLSGDELVLDQWLSLGASNCNRIQSVVGYSLPIPVALIWYAGDTIGLADDAFIDVWPDISGNGNDGTNNAGTERPTYKTNFLDGHAVVYFPKFQGQERFHVPNILAGVVTEAEAFLVVKQGQDPPDGFFETNPIWDFGSDPAGEHWPFSDGNIYSDWGSTVRKATGVNPVPSFTDWRVVNVSSKANEWIIRLDGTQIYSTLINTVGWSTDPRIGNAGTHWIAEFIFYDRILTAGERAAVISYLSNKYPSLSI